MGSKFGKGHNVLHLGEDGVQANVYDSVSSSGCNGEATEVDRFPEVGPRRVNKEGARDLRFDVLDDAESDAIYVFEVHRIRAAFDKHEEGDLFQEWNSQIKTTLLKRFEML
jgi:hypothetical protein